MSNLGKACTLASEWVDLMGGLDNISYLYGNDIGILVQAVHAAGLLAPDLPDPELYEEETAYWYEDTYGIGVGRLTKNSPVRIMLWDSEPGGVLYTDIESARDYALKILAACEYAEKMVHDE